jgi:hypothetical protein
MGLPLACHLAVEDDMGAAQKVKSMIAAAKRRLHISISKTGVQGQRSRGMSTSRRKESKEGMEILC